MMQILWAQCGSLLVGVVLLISVMLPVAAQTPQESRPTLESGKIVLNFVNANIETVIEAVSKITGKTFVLDPRVKGTVNVISGKPVDPEMAYVFLLAALRMQGFAAVGVNGVVKVMPEADAKTHAGRASLRGKGQGMAPGADMVTRVFQLKNESATQIVAVLRPLIAPSNSIMANAGNNSVVITDYADNIDRLAQIVAGLDESSGEDPQVIPLRNASAIDVAATVTRLFGESSNETSQRVSIASDARSNSIIVKTDNPAKLSRIRSLVKTLDQPGSAAGNIHVVYLRNAEAARVAQTLRAVMGGDSGAQGVNTSLSGSFSGQTQGGMTPVGNSPSANSPTGSFPSNNAASGNLTGGPVQADTTNNALIITAPDAVFNNLRSVIEMLDKRRAQVFVEALIVEISAERASESGIQWQSLAGTHVFTGTNFNSGGKNIVGLVENLAKATTTGSVGLAPGLNLGLIGSIGTNGIPTLNMLARLLETDVKANILSTPTLLTLDNEEAKIIIGRNVPFVTGQYAQTGNAATASPFQTYERKDVGLTLKIRPQISEGGLVRMQIFQEASSVQESTLSNPAGPSTNKRSIETSVIVDDGGLIVIGGLIEDSYGSGQDKVPVAGDIPLLGALFRYDTRKRTKTNLMVFLRPKIIRDENAYRSITADRYDYVIGEQRRIENQSGLMFGEAAPPELPRTSPLEGIAAPR